MVLVMMMERRRRRPWMDCCCENLSSDSLYNRDAGDFQSWMWDGRRYYPRKLYDLAAAVNVDRREDGLHRTAWIVAMVVVPDPVAVVGPE